ncbi:MAG: hypothetical protein N2C14_07500, partial [Planctomycetales bacterium]
MRGSRIASGFFAVAICLCIPAWACMWDTDTLAVERSRFPNSLELITGKFLRHSREFYQWRADDRSRRMKDGESSPEIYDDLSVAYEKLDDHNRAIQTALEKETKFPGLYETRANLGTFYIHAGDLEAGVREIERAIEINPDAHFGREIYQKHLVGYVLSKRTDDNGGALKLPLDSSDPGENGPFGFAVYVLEANRVESGSPVSQDEMEKAAKGVLGMMRFGNYDSPVLLE